MPSLSDLRWQLGVRLSRLMKSEAAVRYWQQAWIERAIQVYRQETEISVRRYEQHLQDARGRYDRTISEIRSRAQALRKADSLARAGWDDPSWKSWRPGTVQPSTGANQAMADSVRIGWLKAPWTLA